MNILLDTRTRLYEAFQEALAEAIAKEVLPKVEIPPFVIEIPADKSHGDFATNLAMLLAKPCRMAPRAIAEVLVAHFQKEAVGVSAIEIAGPGFINLRLKDGWLLEVLPAIQKEDVLYGKSQAGLGERVLIEFVSANPTGLLHMGNARGGALGDALAAVMNTAGYQCDKEYYINDAGNQVNNLGLSLEVRYLEALGKEAPPLPEDGYRGEDIKKTAEHLIENHGDGLLALERNERLKQMTDFALKEKVAGIREALTRFGVSFDRWFSEQTLHDSGAVKETIETLRARGYVYEKDGATWLKATAYGEEKDEVLIKSDGAPTYFAADIAYHKDKFDRGYTRLIDIWGADHHGHVARIKNALTALGYNGDALTVILVQLVHLYRDGELVRMSKRAGNIVTLDDLMDEVGRDAARFFFVARTADSPLNFDLNLAKEESSNNPVYYVQYAHARIVSLLSAAGRPCPRAEDIDTSLLDKPEEKALLLKLSEFPEEIATAARELAPNRLGYYARDLAGLFHSFYTHCKVLSDDEALTDARLVLADGCRIVLRNVLTLIGVDAPERM